jgi:cytochrome c oxidase subunit 1
MTTLDYIPASADSREDYLNISYRVKSWLLTVDHKRIGILYLIAITVFFFVGGAFATAIRLELMTPRGDLMTAETYNKVFTLHGRHHGLLLPDPHPIPRDARPTFLVPLMIGARDPGVPPLNLHELVHLHDRRAPAVVGRP